MKVRDITKIVKKDQFGPEYVFELFNEERGGVLGWLVIDNAARGGIGKGGTAMYPTNNLEITLMKARNMTWKEVFCNPIGQNSKYPIRGGAKGGICYNSQNLDAGKILKEYLLCLGNYELSPGKYIIPDKYIFDLDVGLNEIATKMAAKLLGPKSTTAKPKELGGIPYDELGITGFGVLRALEVIAEFAEMNLENSTMAIQGFGAVGRGIVMHLQKMKGSPKIIAVSDKSGAIFNREQGLDLKLLLSTPKNSVVSYSGKACPFDLGKELYLRTDVLVLAYGEDQITLGNVKKIKAPIILSGANMGIHPQAEKIHCKKFGPWAVLPDFVINAGAAIASLVEETEGAIDEGFKYVEEVITHNVRLVIEGALAEKKLPRKIALNIAKEEVKKAMQKRAANGSF